MSKSPQQPDKEEEARFEQMLKSGYGDTPPSREFQEGLLQELDQEFARTYFSASADSSALPTQVTSANGVASLASDASSDRSRPRRFIGLRLATTMAAAASLLLVVALWNSQNAYGWTAMIRAIEQCGWVQAVSQSTGLSGWVSSQRGVLAIRDGEEVVYHDHRERVTSQYSSDHQVVYRQSLNEDMASTGTADQLMGMLLRNSSTAGFLDSAGYEVIAESWRHLDEDQAKVELLVTLRESNAQRRTHKLRILMDAESQLPSTIELLARERNAKKSLAFEYPADGPTSIFAMGVPQQTKVVVLRSDGQADLTEEARTAESRRQIAQQDQVPEERDIVRIAAVPRRNESDLLESSPRSEELTDDEEQSGAELALGAKKPSDGQPLAKEFVELSDGPTVVADEIVTAPAKTGPTESALVDAKANEEQPAERLASKTNSPRREVWEFDSKLERLSLPELVGKVNDQLNAHWQTQGITVAEPATDTEFLRRVYLDLTGRIPIPFEVYQFLESDPATRREKLVDQLLESRDHATHLATVWRKLLLPDGVDTNTYGGTGKFDEWLADRFEKNLPYDEIVSQLLLAEGRVSDSGPILFYAALKLNPEEIAAKTARTFLGMRMECAQCHDHPFDESISQEDFWGFAAHFAQISRPRGKIEMTSSVLRVRDNPRGEVMMPDTEDVVPPQLPYQVAMVNGGEKKPGKEASRRQQLVDWLTTKQNNRFARATVNRVWQHLFGLGMVEPVDDMRADNLPTCPEVLDTLSHDFAANDYDLRRLLRTLVLSDAYQLSSRAPSDEPSQLLEFARMNIKSFTADQLYDCINVATEPTSAGNGNNQSGSLVRFGNTARQAFIEQFQAPPGQRTDYHAGIPQALTLMHGQLVHSATDLASSGLLKGISAPFFSGDEERIETLFLSTLSRFPEEVELEKMLSHVQAAEGDEQRMRAFGDVLWALLNSAEFTFIH